MGGPDKPTGEGLGWRLRDTRYLYRSSWFDLRQDEVDLPGGTHITYTFVEHPGFVSVVPVTPQHDVVLIRVYRYTLDQWLWETPAGGLGGHQGRPPVEVAAAELLEETGYASPEPLREIGRFYSGVGNTNTPCFVFLATDVRRVARPQPEETEMIDVRIVPAREAVAMARSGAIADEHSALGLLLAEPFLLGGG